MTMREIEVIFIGSGGGNKGCLQAGHIKAVRDWIKWSNAHADGAINVKALAGTSIGAVNVGLWASDVEDRVLKSFWENAGLGSFGSFNWKFFCAALKMCASTKRGYILHTNVIRKFLESYLPENWDGFSHPFYVGVSAYSRSGKELLSTANGGIPENPMVRHRTGSRCEQIAITPLGAILTSIAIPGVFPQLWYADSYWGDAACMLNKIPILNDLCTPVTVTVASILGYAGLTSAEEQAKFWPWEWMREGREKVSMEEYQAEIYGWGEQVSDHVFRSPERGWLVVMHNLEGRSLPPYDYSKGAELYNAGLRHGQTVLTEFEGVFEGVA